MLIVRSFSPRFNSPRTHTPLAPEPGKPRAHKFQHGIMATRYHRSKALHIRRGERPIPR